MTDPLRKDATTKAPGLSPVEIKKLYDEAVAKQAPAPAPPKPEESPLGMFTLPPGLEPGSLEKALSELKVPGPEDRAMMAHVVKRAYVAVAEKDYAAFIKYFGKLRRVIEHYQPDSLTDEFLLFVSDQEMWQWFDLFKQRVATKPDQVYAYYLGEELLHFVESGGIFK
jgi:hypothetical protein